MVYIIVANNFEYLKIGMTKNIKGRMNNLQSGCPFRLSLWASIRTDKPNEMETYLHSEFAEFNVRGEWFSMPDSQLDKLLYICDQENMKTKERLNEMV